MENSAKKVYVIAMMATKGGVGKTLTAANLGGLLADFGFRVLLLDGDTQGSLTTYFSIERQSVFGLNEVINRGGRIDADCISKIAYTPINPNGSLDIILCNASAEIENWLLLRGDRDSIVKRAMRSPIVAENYDVVIIDTRGTEGQPLQCSSAMAADVMLSPISPDTVSAKEFVKGTLGLLERLNQSSDMIPELRTGPMIAFINKMDKSNDARQVAQAVRDNFRTHPNIKIMDTVVPQWATFKSASTLAQPVHRVDARANLVMHELVWEIFPNLRAQFAENLVDTDVGGHSA